MATGVLFLYLCGVGVAVARAPGRALTEPGVPYASSRERPASNPARMLPSVKGGIAPGSVSVLYRGHDARYWAMKYRKAGRTIRAERARARRLWHPTVVYALRLASAVFGVPYWELSSVSRCESNHYPGATNGRFKGLFQLGWSPFGMSPFDPVASALSAAETVVHDGSWRQWECKP